MSTTRLPQALIDKPGWAVREGETNLIVHRLDVIHCEI